MFNSTVCSGACHQMTAFMATTSVCLVSLSCLNCKNLLWLYYSQWLRSNQRQTNLVHYSCCFAALETSVQQLRSIATERMKHNFHSLKRPIKTVLFKIKADTAPLGLPHDDVKNLKQFPLYVISPSLVVTTS